MAEERDVNQLTDIRHATAVGIQVYQMGNRCKVWLCVDGACRIRINSCDYLNVNIPGYRDYRFGEEPIQE